MASTYKLTQEQVERVENNFTYHSPFGDQTARYQKIRNEAKNLAIHIMTFTPPSREQSLALTHLEDAIMWANASIARNEKKETNSGSAH